MEHPRANQLAQYIIGFVLSLSLTACAYVAVTQKLFDGRGLIALIIGLAVLQVLVQLFFFLHLGHETKPRWKMVVLLFMLIVLGIVVIGSLWIMQNLDYNMHPQEASEYIIKDEGIKL